MKLLVEKFERLYRIKNVLGHFVTKSGPLIPWNMNKLKDIKICKNSVPAATFNAFFVTDNPWKTLRITCD